MADTNFCENEHDGIINGTAAIGVQQNVETVNGTGSDSDASLQKGQRSSIQNQKWKKYSRENFYNSSPNK